MQSHLSVILDHDVAVVPVSDAEDERGDTIPCARAREQINSLVVPGGKRKDEELTFEKAKSQLKPSSLSSNRVPKPFHSHLPLVLVLEPLMQCVAVELQRPLEAAFALDLHDGVGVPHHLDQAHAVTDGQAAVRQHPWWEA